MFGYDLIWFGKSDLDLAHFKFMSVYLNCLSHAPQEIELKFEEQKERFTASIQLYPSICPHVCPYSHPSIYLSI